MLRYSLWFNELLLLGSSTMKSTAMFLHALLGTGLGNNVPWRFNLDAVERLQVWQFLRYWEMSSHIFG
jgi:hypothetical protein